MNLSKQGETRLNAPSPSNHGGGGTSLNPNAAEFVPFSLRGSATATASTPPIPNPTVFTASAPASSGKKVLDRSESSISTNSDEEAARQYWQHQLPDDITPDFQGMGEDDESLPLSLAGLSLHTATANQANSLSAAAVAPANVISERSDFASARQINGVPLSEKISHLFSSVYGNDPSPTSYLQQMETNKPWEMQPFGTDDHFAGGGADGMSLYESMHRGYADDVISESCTLGNSDVNPVEFLAAQFPGFAAESLAEVYFANGCDLNLTIEILTQLELQVDGAFSQNVNSKTLSAPNLTSMDFPALPVPDNKSNLPKYAGDELHRTANPYGLSGKDNLLFFKSGSSLSTKGATDFASTVRKLASQDNGLWKYNRNGASDASIGSSRSSHTSSGSYNTGAGRNAYNDRLHARSSARAAPTWLETGDAVANMYSELRGEARDHARIRNAYFEQAREAYLLGNKALAKELSLKGQLHNMQMKAAHHKAQESIYRQRNPVGPEMQGGRNQEKIIDLHGLHVTEALQRLRHELSVLKNAARSAEQRLPVYICVGTGHHTRGARTPARLPVAVQRYLLEDEGLQFTETQPGLLRVVLY